MKKAALRQSFLDGSEENFLRYRSGSIFQGESEVIHMLTFQDLIAFTALLVELVGLVIIIMEHYDNRK